VRNVRAIRGGAAARPSQEAVFVVELPKEAANRAQRACRRIRIEFATCMNQGKIDRQNALVGARKPAICTQISSRDRSPVSDGRLNFLCDQRLAFFRGLYVSSGGISFANGLQTNSAKLRAERWK
jgi:hypothetical protein